MVNESAAKVVESAGKAKNPLLDLVLKDIDSAEEWLTRWRQTSHWHDMLSLIHLLTAENRWLENPELASLLLGVADGYVNDYNFNTAGESDSSYRNKIAKRRRAIAEKAFGVLCQKFFQCSTRDHGPLWWWALNDEALFKKILWFIRLDEHQNIRNYDRHRTDANGVHQQEVFREFLRQFAQLGWNYDVMNRRHSDRNYEVSESLRIRLINCRPQFIEILCGLCELDWLNGQELDDSSIKKLTELALSQCLHLPHRNVRDRDGYRKPGSLEEAVLGDSAPAQVVLLSRIREKEKQRIEALYKESERVEETQQRQRELDELARKKKELERREKELKKTGT